VVRPIGERRYDLSPKLPTRCRVADVALPGILNHPVWKGNQTGSWKWTRILRCSAFPSLCHIIPKYVRTRRYSLEIHFARCRDKSVGSFSQVDRTQAPVANVYYGASSAAFSTDAIEPGPATLQPHSSAHVHDEKFGASRAGVSAILPSARNATVRVGFHREGEFHRCEDLRILSTHSL